jgi:hypothetical protein
MIDKGRLNNKQVAFRIVGSDLVHIGVVKSVERDGFWIESPQFIEQMQADRFWGPTVAQIGTPIFFVPTSSLMFVIAKQEWGEHSSLLSAALIAKPTSPEEMQMT